MQTAPVDGIEQQKADQPKQKHKEVWVQVPQIRHDHIAELGQSGDLGVDLLVGKAEEYCANQKTQEAGD